VAASMKPAPILKPDATFYSSHPDNQHVDLYRWEFIRRNEQYKADYEHFFERFGPWFKVKRCRLRYGGTRLKRTRSDEAYFREKIEPVLMELCKKWDVFNLCPPDWDVDVDLMRRRKDWPHGWVPTSSRGNPSRDFRYSRKEVKRRYQTGPIGRLYGKILVVEFELDRPLKDLLRDARKAIEMGQKSYNQSLEAAGRKLPRGRRRFEDYDKHLRVWDLHQDNKSRREIAKAVFPSMPEEIGLRRVRDHIRAARRLISGGYKEIR
jgi:hypothetical protein